MAETRAHVTFLDPHVLTHYTALRLWMTDTGPCGLLGEQGKTQTPAASGITTAPAHFLVLTSQHPIFKWLYFIFSKMQNFYFKISELGSILNLMDEKHHCVISSAGNFFLSWWDIFYNHWHLRFDEIWYL